MSKELEPVFELAVEIEAIKLSLGRIIAEVAATYGENRQRFISEVYSIPRLETDPSKPEGMANKLNDTLIEIEKIATAFALGKKI